MLPDWMVITEENFPIGSNGLWHGGIHIKATNNRKWIKPLYTGTVITGRIQEDKYIENYGGKDNEFSTSYVLLEHKMKFKLSQQPASFSENQFLDFIFYSLYMHLQPYKMYERYETLSSLDLPFYLRWKEMKILETSVLPQVKKIVVDGHNLYNDSVIETDEPKWFYPNNMHITRKNIIQVKIKTTIDTSSSIVNKSISSNNLSLLQLPKIFSIIPENTNIPVSVYGHNTDYEQYFIGKIKSKCTVTINEDTTFHMQPIRIDRQNIEEIPSGIVFETITNSALERDVALFEAQKNDITSSFMLISPDDYLQQFQQRCFPNTRLNRKQKAIVEEERKKINDVTVIDGFIIVSYSKRLDISALQLTNMSPQLDNTPRISAAPTGNNGLSSLNVIYKNPNNIENIKNEEEFFVLLRGNNYIAGRAHTTVMHDLRGGTQLESYKLSRKAVIKTGFKLWDTGQRSALLNKPVYTILFDNSTPPIFTDITDYVYVEEGLKINGKINADNSNLFDVGIPCCDNTGYIRNLLVHSNSFRPVTGSMINSHRINITGINTYGNKREQRYIVYNDKYRFSGVSEIDNDKRDRNNNEAGFLALRKGIMVNDKDLIGFPSLFFCATHQSFCHLEVFMKNDDLINHLFTGEYKLNIYDISKIKIYKKIEGENNAVTYHLLQEQERTGIPSELYDYQMKIEEDGVYYEFKSEENKYYIKAEDKNTVSVNMLDFEATGFTRSENDSDDDIYCDDQIITTFKNINRTGLRKYVCKFPFGWNAALYTHCEDRDCGDCNEANHNRCEHLPNKLVERNIISNFPTLSRIMRRADVKSHTDFLQGEVKPKVWHYNPIGFYSHYNDILKTQSFNPYEGLSNRLSKTFQEDTTGEPWFPLEPWTVVINDNPGFAPTVERERNGIHGKRFEGYYFSNLNNFTSPYGVLRRNPNGNHLRHTGIDLATRGDKTPIVALVHGIVWAYSANIDPTFGRVLFIKGTNDDKLYFLAHLERNIKKVDEHIVPGEEVAITGDTGDTTGIHLHLEVFRNITGGIREILNIDNIGRPNMGFSTWWGITDFRSRRIDPFNHNIHII